MTSYVFHFKNSLSNIKTESLYKEVITPLSYNWKLPKSQMRLTISYRLQSAKS